MTINMPIDTRDADLACFAIWEHGRSKEAEIINDLEQHFEVLGVFHVYWSEQHYNRNIARLYENADQTNPFYRFDKKIGKPPFCFIIVKDKSPIFTYMKTVSGAIEAVNKNIVDRKNEYRSWFEKRYQIHSSCNFREFSSQSAMILGMPVLEATLQGQNKGSIVSLEKDLEGADGWQNWEQLFAILNYTSSYVCLSDPFAAEKSGNQLDFLCDRFQSFASTANVQQDLTRPFVGQVSVSGDLYQMNMRFVGDRFFSGSWEKDMLDHRILDKGVYVPCAEDLFFSRLYAAKLFSNGQGDQDTHKIKSLAEELSFDWFPSEKLADDRAIGTILSGYMRANSYFYEPPIDGSLRPNPIIVKELPKLNDIGMSKGAQRKKRWNSAIKRLKHKIRGQFKTPK